MSELKDAGLAQEALNGEWVGEVELARKRLFLRLELRLGMNELPGALDLPGEFTVRHKVVAVRQEVERIAFGVQAHEQPWHFEGERSASGISGTCRLADEPGTFSIHQVFDLAPAQYHPYVGTYRLSADRQVTLGLQCDPDWKPFIYFYQEGDRLVRLYPLSATSLLSERGETILLETEVSGDGPHLTWREGGATPVAASRRNTHREEEVHMQSSEVTLAGTLLLPQTSTPCPAVVLVHGSIPSLRDYYRVFAQPFVEQGIAALIYDKRGSGASTGSADSTIEERAADAQAAVTYLQTRQEIDPRWVGLWGLSNGTWSIPKVAARMTEQLAFLIAVGAAGVTMARAEVYRKLCELREWGIAEEVLSQVERAWSIIYEYAASGQWNERWDEEFESLIRNVHAVEELHHIPLQHYARENPVLSPIPPLLTARQLKEGYGGLAPDSAYDPIEDYERVRCPVLFLMGELDKNLPPQECVSRVEQALQRGHHHNHMIKVFPQTGHSMNVISLSFEGMTLEEATHLLYQYRFTPGFLDLMSRWVMEQVGHRAEGDGSSVG